MFRRLAHLIAYLFRRRRLEDDLDEELRSSFDMVVDQHLARGLSHAEARRAARLEFEGLEQVKESVRDGLAGPAIHSFLHDLRYAARGLRRNPSFALIAVATLALGIGVNTAVFSVFYGVLLHPLPYEKPEQLVRIWGMYKTAGFARSPVSGQMLAEIERRNRSLSGVAAIWAFARTFPGDDPEEARFARVSANFFDVMGVKAARGRTFTAEDRGGPGVVLTDGFFRRRFGGNAALLGQGIGMKDAAATLAGVLPANFQLHFAPDANIPLNIQAFDAFPANLPRQSGLALRLVARLKPGVNLEQARQDLNRVAQDMRRENAAIGALNLQFGMSGLQDDAFRDVQPALTALFAGAVFVLLICAVNVTSLLVARGSGRRKEIGLRLALGASRGRILRQLLTECTLLCVLGGAAGIAAGWAGFRALLAIAPERLAHMAGTGLNWRVLAFAAASTFGAALLFGLAPAIESFRVDLIASLRTSGRSWLGRVQRRAGAALVVCEIAVAFVLVTGAGLAARTLSKIEQLRPGFEPRQLLTFQLRSQNRTGDMFNPAERNEIHAWAEAIASLPGVQRVGAVCHLPLDDIPNWYGPYRPEGRTENEASVLVADYRVVTNDYLAALGARLVEGRYFDPRDDEHGQRVVIVDELVARSSWPGEAAVGKRLFTQETSYVVAGVVEHVRNHSLTQQVRGELYFPFEQHLRGPLTWVVRTSVPPLSVLPAIRGLMPEPIHNAFLTKIRPMNAYVAREFAPVSFTAVLAAVFGVLALVLAITGIYGVLNYQVSRRLPEMGIRMALGAEARDVLRLVMREGLMLASAGIVAGVGAVMLAAHWLSAVVYGIAPQDPFSFGIALLLLPAAALLGCWRPARRAAAASPADMIREE